MSLLHKEKKHLFLPFFFSHNFISSLATSVITQLCLGTNFLCDVMDYFIKGMKNKNAKIKDVKEKPHQNKEMKKKIK